MTLREQFEAVFLEGKVRENILVASQLQLGADGEYFNQNTRALFSFYQRGHADGCQDVEHAIGVKMPIPEDVGSWDHERMVYNVDEIEAAIEAAGGTCIYAEPQEPDPEPEPQAPPKTITCKTCNDSGTHITAGGSRIFCESCDFWGDIPF